MTNLSKLAGRVRAQLAKKYPNPYDREYAYYDLTVRQLLEMLEEMGDEEDV